MNTLPDKLNEAASALETWAANNDGVIGFLAAHERANSDLAIAYRAFIDALLAEREIGQAVGLRLGAELRSLNAAVDTFKARSDEAHAMTRPDTLRFTDSTAIRGLARTFRDYAAQVAATA